MTRKERRWMEAGMAAIGVFLGVAVFCVMVILWSPAYAEEADCWVMCNPGDYVNIRRSPDRHSEVCGWADSGMRLRTDWEEKHGFVHVIGVTEYGEGWISASYVVYEEPRAMDTETVIAGRGRVAARKCIGGARKKWVKPGEAVTVYTVADGWAVTDHGWIRTEYLEGF